MHLPRFASILVGTDLPAFQGKPVARPVPQPIPQPVLVKKPVSKRTYYLMPGGGVTSHSKGEHVNSCRATSVADAKKQFGSIL